MLHKIQIKMGATSSFFTASFSFDGKNPANYAIYSGEGNFGKITGEGVSQTQATGNTGLLPDGNTGLELSLVGHYASTRFASTGDLLYERGYPGDFTAIANFNTGVFHETGLATIIGGTGRFKGATGTEKLIQDGVIQVGGGNPPNSTGAFGSSQGSFDINITVPTADDGIYYGSAAGQDKFVFSSPTEEISKIGDFTPGTDIISLQRGNFGDSSFTGVAAPAASDGKIDFVTGEAPIGTTSDPTLLYNTTTGALSFDSDGTGGTAARQFATFIGNPTLSASDFVVPVNNAPTELILTSKVTTLAENSNVTGGIKVADINIMDDDFGANNLSLSGADQSSFEIRQNALFYVGSSPNFETKNSYQVTVNVDDPTVGKTPDTSVNFALAITPPPPPLTLKGGTAQIAFVSYYGRPSDNSGASFWNKFLTDSGISYSPRNGDFLTGSEPAAYKTFVDAFGVPQPEANRLYGGKSTSDQVNAVYNFAFNRNADEAGKNFWVNEIASGRVNLTTVALEIALGAQNDDIFVLSNKIASADLFSQSIDTPAEIAAYSGSKGESFGRDFLAGFGATVCTQAQVDAALTNLVNMG